MGHLVGGLLEILHDGIISRVFVQVLLSDVQGLQLLDCVVVMGDLWEGE